MDERELSKLFRDAAGHPPPASFDHDDVLGASRRATARRRSALAGGSLLGVAVLGGGLLLGGQLVQPAAPEAPAGPPPVVATAPEPSGRAAPQPLSTLDAPGNGRWLAPGLGPCGPADPVLAVELTDALDARRVAPSGPSIPLTAACPPGSRAAGVPVAGGAVYLVVSPAVSGTGEGGSVRPDGARSYTVASASTGDLVSVLSVPAPQQPAPLGEHVDDLARELAAQL